MLVFTEGRHGSSPGAVCARAKLRERRVTRWMMHSALRVVMARVSPLGNRKQPESAAPCRSRLRAPEKRQPEPHA
eukprot:3035988-Rhodomonas_salina.1